MVASLTTIFRVSFPPSVHYYLFSLLKLQVNTETLLLQLLLSRIGVKRASTQPFNFICAVKDKGDCFTCQGYSEPFTLCA